MNIFLNIILGLLIILAVVLVLFIGFGIYVSGKSDKECEELDEKINKYWEIFWQ